MNTADKVGVLDHGYVQLVESWGSDERIIESARMSTNKGFEGWGPIHEPRCSEEQEGESGPRPCSCNPKSGDERLLSYLWKNRHHTPFEMAGLTIEVQAPLFVFREWHRHRTQSYNELSGRYTELPDLYYVPSIERLRASKQSTSNKQSSEVGFTEVEATHIQQDIYNAYQDARFQYEKLLARGVAKEVARVVVPVSQYSRMRASGNLRNWLGFLTLRTDKAAQWEIRQYADVVAGFVSQLFPRTFDLWKGI